MLKYKILKFLRSTPLEFLSGEQVAKRCGITRTMVWKHVKSLQEEGYEIEAVPSQGYRLTHEPDILRAFDLRRGLKSKTIGKEIKILPIIESTNTHAMEIASQGAAEGTAVIAETQTSGKGRIGRKWFSPKGNIYTSIILRPNISVNRSPLITLMGAVAVVSTLRTMCNVRACIKWPNDIFVSEKKISGILTEMSAEQDQIRHIVLGIGINVNMAHSTLPLEIRTSATTLACEMGQVVDRTSILQKLFVDIERWYLLFLRDPKVILQEWKGLNMTIGKNVIVHSTGDTFAGKATDIDDEGRLIIVLTNGIVRRIAAGDVSLQPD